MPIVVCKEELKSSQGNQKEPSLFLERYSWNKPQKKKKIFIRMDESEDSPEINATMYHYLIYIYHKEKIQQGESYVT